MCGRFAFQNRIDALENQYPWLELDPRIPERYNIAPTTPAAVVPNKMMEKEIFSPASFEGGSSSNLDWPQKMPTSMMHFGFKVKFGSGTIINTRDDKLLEGKGFWQRFKNNRCLVLANGFYEWQLQDDGKTKQPYYFQIDGGRPFAFAGLFQIIETEDGVRAGFSILTTTATPFVAEIHNTKKRMPVILPLGRELDWVNPDKMELAEIGSFLKKYPEEQVSAHPVSRAVGNPSSAGPQLIEPIEDQKKLL